MAQIITDAAHGTGPVDAVYKAINRIVRVPNELIEFSVNAVTEGIDAVGEVTIRIEAEAHGDDDGLPMNPQTGNARTYSAAMAPARTSSWPAAAPI